MSTTPNDTPSDGRPALEPDEVRRTAGLGPALETLRGLPPVPPGAVDRVVAAAVARGHRPGQARRGAPARPSLSPGVWRVAAALLVAAGVGGALWSARRGAPASVGAPVAVAANAPAADVPASVLSANAVYDDPQGDVFQAAAAADPDAPLPTAFLLRRPAAARVHLVGDFNGWDSKATPLARGADGTWTATLPLAPGRHAYAFVVDDSAWVTDPRVPATRDVDYGRDHSVVVVGAP
jgi:hypothetical protein